LLYKIILNHGWQEDVSSVLCLMIIIWKNILLLIWYIPSTVYIYHSYWPALGPTQPPIQWETSLGVNRQGRESGN
jgi:hypothetical protein